MGTTPHLLKILKLFKVYLSLTLMQVKLVLWGWGCVAVMTLFFTRELSCREWPSSITVLISSGHLLIRSLAPVPTPACGPADIYHRPLCSNTTTWLSSFHIGNSWPKKVLSAQISGQWGAGVYVVSFVPPPRDSIGISELPLIQLNNSYKLQIWVV